MAIPGQNSQVALGADDVIILCGNSEDIKESQQVVEEYAKASGGRVNWEKSVGILIGKCKEEDVEKKSWIKMQVLGDGEQKRYLGFHSKRRRDRHGPKKHRWKQEAWHGINGISRPLEEHW